MTSYQKLLKAIKSRDLHEAHEVFKDIMQQKVAMRLAEEKQNLMKECTCGDCDDCKKMNEGQGRLYGNPDTQSAKGGDTSTKHVSDKDKLPRVPPPRRASDLNKGSVNEDNDDKPKFKGIANVVKDADLPADGKSGFSVKKKTDDKPKFGGFGNVVKDFDY